MRLVRIGRGETSDRRLSDPTVSRRHAELVVLDDGRLYLSDCASTGGTFVEQNRAWEPVRQGFVDAEARVKFGNVVVRAAELK